MKPFEITKALTVDDALQSSGLGSKFIAGGTNLVDLMKYQIESPDRLIDITHLPLKDVKEQAGGIVRIGALVPNSDLAEHRLIKERYPVLSQALLSGASPQLRNMATVGGNLLQRTRCYYFMDAAFPCNKRDPGSGCPAIDGINRIHAILGHSPSCIATHPSDMAVALSALDAIINIQGTGGVRQAQIEEFYRLPEDHPEIETTLRPGELIVSVDLPRLPGASHSTYLKVRDRAQFAFALVSVAAAMDVRSGIVHDIRIALGGVAAKPWRAREAEKLLIGRPANPENFHLAAEAALKHASAFAANKFKIELAKRSIVRALEGLHGGVA